MVFFHIRNIDDVLSTGGLPEDTKQIDRLKEQGFSTIVSLEPLNVSLASYARKQGLKVVNLSVGWHKPVSQDKIKRFLSLAALAQAKGGKIFLHCLQGHDRAMEMTAAYMITKRAYKRAVELGLTGPLRLFETDFVNGMRTHFEKTLKRALKYRRRL